MGTKIKTWLFTELIRRLLWPLTLIFAILLLVWNNNFSHDTLSFFIFVTTLGISTYSDLLYKVTVQLHAKRIPFFLYMDSLTFVLNHFLMLCFRLFFILCVLLFNRSSWREILDMHGSFIQSSSSIQTKTFFSIPKTDCNKRQKLSCYLLLV